MIYDGETVDECGLCDCAESEHNTETGICGGCGEECEFEEADPVEDEEGE